MKILAILQARFSSTRLPGKVLKPILGKPMLRHQIERIRRARRIDKLMVATSAHPSDDALQKLCAEAGITCHRGSLDDVLDRFYQAARTQGVEYVVRLTGDCPLADPAVIDRVVDACLESGADYASNVFPPTYPDGLDVEVFRFAALERAWREGRLPSEREHVTPYIHQHPELFRQVNVSQENDLSALRWTVDNPADFEFVREVYEALYPHNPAFATADILDLLARRPELGKINTHLQRNEGYAKSLAEDQSFLKSRGT
ncbi:MAG: glycosyltransferase family protein [Pseudomonadota bacterium]|jgi:spore coat polysaccharide biosynthesis protein SpsF